MPPDRVPARSVIRRGGRAVMQRLAKPYTATPCAGSIPAPSASLGSSSNETRSTNQDAALATMTDQRLRAGTRKRRVENRESRPTRGSDLCR